MTARELLIEYKAVIYDIYGTYLDATSACQGAVRDMFFSQQDSMKRFNLTQEEIDERKKAYTDTGPYDPNFRVLHVSTQGEFKARNSEGGRNITILGQLLVTQVYSYWEDHYRGLVAAATGVMKDELKSDVFEDLRHFRHSIIHHRGIALENVGKCKILTLFDEGELIELTSEQVEFILMAVVDDIDRLL